MMDDEMKRLGVFYGVRACDALVARQKRTCLAFSMSLQNRKSNAFLPPITPVSNIKLMLEKNPRILRRH
jgi:hypothetical protein